MTDNRPLIDLQSTILRANENFKPRDPNLGDAMHFALTDNPLSETDAQAAAKADMLGNIYMDMLRKANEPIDENMSDDAARAEAVYFGQALTGRTDVYGSLWKKEGFKSGREYLTFMREFVKKGPEQNKTQALRDFEAKSEEEQIAEALENRKLLDKVSHLGGITSEVISDVVPQSLLDVYRVGKNIPGELDKLSAEEKAYGKKVRDQYYLKLLSENAWMEVAGILPRLSDEKARRCLKAMMDSEDGTLPSELEPVLNGLSDEDMRLLSRARAALKPKVGESVWNTIGDMAVGFVNVGSNILTAPYRFGNKLENEIARVFNADWFDYDEIARRRQYAHQITGSFFAGGDLAAGALPQLQFEQFCDDHGIIADALIVTVSTLPYMWVASQTMGKVPVGMVPVALEAMNEFDDHIAFQGGSTEGIGNLFTSALFGALYAYTERLQFGGILKNVSDLELRGAMLKGVWAGLKSGKLPKSLAIGTFTESVEEGIQNGLMGMREALALDENPMRAFGEGFVEDFISSLGTMFLIGAGGHVIGHVKRSGGIKNVFGEAGWANRSEDLATAIKDSMLTDRLVEYADGIRSINLSAETIQIANNWKTWMKGGVEALVNSGMDLKTAAKVAKDFELLRSAANEERKVSEEEKTKAESSIALYNGIIKALQLDANAKTKKKTVKAFKGTIEEIDFIRSVWAQGAGIYREVKDNDGKTKIVDPGALALMEYGMSEEAAKRLSRQFHYERAAAYSPTALEGVRAAYEAKMRGKVTGEAALRKAFGGVLRTVKTLGKDLTNIDFSQDVERLGESIEEETSGKVTKEMWSKMTPEERAKAWKENALSIGGYYRRNDGTIVFNTMTRAGNLRVNDTSVGFHETLHALKEEIPELKLAILKAGSEERAAEEFRDYVSRYLAGDIDEKNRNAAYDAVIEKIRRDFAAEEGEKVMKAVTGNRPSGTQKEAGVNYPDASEEIREFAVGSFAEDAKRLILKKRPDMAKAEEMLSAYEHIKQEKNANDDQMRNWYGMSKPISVDATISEMQKFPTSKEKKAALHWFVKGAIKLPEDAYKVTEAIQYGERAKGKGKNIDPFSYDSPMAMIDALREFQPKAKPIDPDTVPTLSDKRVLPGGVTTYLVDESEESQRAMRQIINTHWGEDANPWCLLCGDGKGNLSDGRNGTYDARYYWEHYSSLPKRVAFKDGKLLAFMATDERTYDPDNFAEEFMNPFREEYPEIVSEYEEWIETEEGQENWTNFHDWLEVNYPQELEAYKLDTPEKWWDRQDKDHVGIPLGNMAVPGDEFGRWANYEIRDGKAVMTSGFIKFNTKGEAVTEWFANGNLARTIDDQKEVTFYNHGGVDQYRELSGAKTFVFDPKGMLVMYRLNGEENVWLEEDKPAPEEVKVEAERILREYDQRTLPDGATELNDVKYSVRSAIWSRPYDKDSVSKEESTIRDALAEGNRVRLFVESRYWEKEENTYLKRLRELDKAWKDLRDGKTLSIYLDRDFERASEAAKNNIKIARYMRSLIDNRDWGKSPIKIKRSGYIDFEQLDNLVAALGEDGKTLELYKRARTAAEKLGISRVRLASTNRENLFGQELGGFVKLDPEYLSSDIILNKDKLETITHEILHAVTSYALHPGNKITNPKVREAAERIKALYDNYRMDKDLRGMYGMKSVYEFIAELSNEKFRSALEKKGVLVKIVDAIKKFFIAINEFVNGDKIAESGEYSRGNLLQEAEEAVDLMLGNVDGDAFYFIHNIARQQKNFSSFDPYGQAATGNVNGKAFSVSSRLTNERENGIISVNEYSTKNPLRLAGNYLARPFARNDLRRVLARKLRESRYEIHDTNALTGGQVSPWVVQEVFFALNKDKNTAELFSLVFPVAEKLGVEFSFDDKIITRGLTTVNGEERAGVVAYHMNDMVLSLLNNQQVASAILHEMIHSVSTYAMFVAQNGNTVNGVRMSDELIAACKELSDWYEENKSALKLRYGDKSPAEMLAELANPSLWSREMKDKTVKSFLEALIDFVCRALGLKKSAEARARGLEILKAFLDNADTRVMTEIVNAHMGLRGMEGYDMFEEEQALPLDITTDSGTIIDAGDKKYSVSSLNEEKEERTTRLAPNGKRSNLTDRQYDQVRTPEFKAWFGDWENDPANASKVVDENGEPLVVYHGTPNKFTEFRKDKIGSSNNMNTFFDGFYFANKSVIRERAGVEDEYRWYNMSCFVNLRKPFEISLDGTPFDTVAAQEIADSIYKGNGIIPDFEDYLIDIGEIGEDEGWEGRARWERENYPNGIDGIIIKGTQYSNHNIEVVTTEPNQIKSATDNTGAYDATKADIRFSVQSAKYDLDEGEMISDLINAEIMTPEEAYQFRDNLYALVDRIAADAFILDIQEKFDKANRPFKPYKDNSDPLYTVSLDFSTLCKKRLLSQFVIENLQLKYDRALSGEEQLAIRDMFLDYKAKDKALQVACHLCYVEAARLKSPKQINAFLDDPVFFVKDYLAKNSPSFKVKKEAMWAKFKAEYGVESDATKAELKERAGQKAVDELNALTREFRKNYKPTAEEEEILKRAAALPRAQFLSADNLAVKEPVIFAAFSETVRNATRSKRLETAIPYYYGDADVLSDSFIKKMNEQGTGLRHQSWSDFQLQHLLDTIVAVADLSVRGAKMHAYTKVPAFAKCFGKTGIMINLSLMPNLDGVGWSSHEGIDYDTAIRLREEFPETCGTIAIAMSEEHLLKLLADPTIDYVIPYHTSGLNKSRRNMVGIAGWKDFQGVQREKKLDGSKLEEKSDLIPKLADWLVKGKDGYAAMEKSAAKYVKLCNERGIKPKFADVPGLLSGKSGKYRVAAKGYWKLLIDHKMVNQKTGELIEQKPVRPDFDFSEINRQIEEEVGAFNASQMENAYNYVLAHADEIAARAKDLQKRGAVKRFLELSEERAGDALYSVRAYAAEGEDQAKAALENYVAYFKLSHDAAPKPKTLQSMGLALGLKLVNAKEIRQRGEELASRYRGTIIEDAARNGDAASTMAMMIRERDIDAQTDSLLAGAVKMGGELTHRGVGRINELLAKRVKDTMASFTAASLSEMEGDTGLNLAAEILVNDPKAFDTEFKKAKKAAIDPELTAKNQDKKQVEGEGRGEGEGEGLARDYTDQLKHDQLLKKANERVLDFIEKAKARAAKMREKGATAGTKAGERVNAANTNAANDDRIDLTKSGIGPDGNDFWNPKPTDMVANFKTPEEFAAFLREWARYKYEQTVGKTTLGKARDKELFDEFYRMTAIQQLKDLADKLLAPKDENGNRIARIAKLGNGSRVYVYNRLGEIEKGTKADTIERMTADIFAFINTAAIRVNRLDLINDFKKELKKRYLEGAEFEELKADTERKVTGWVEEACRYIIKVCDLSTKAVNGNPSQLEMEYKRLHDIIDRREEVYDESGAAVANAAKEDAETIKARAQLALLDTYGAMRNKMPGEILDLQMDAFDYLESEARALEEAWRETRAKQEEVRAALTGAIVGPKGQKYRNKDLFTGKLFDALNGMIRLRFEHLTRFASEKMRENARDAINTIMVMLGDGERDYALALQRDREAFFSILGNIFKRPDGRADNAAIKRYLERLDEPAPVELTRRISKQGFKEEMTWNQVLQLLVSLEQRSFKDTVEANGRQNHAELIHSYITAEDSQLIDGLRAFYAAKRDELSEVTMRMVGHKVDSPDPLYCPIRRHMDSKARDLHADPSQRWDPISKIFSRRVPSVLDFDEERTIIGLFFENSRESAKLTAWAERGSFIRNVVTTVGFQSAVRSAFGAGELSKILKQLEATFNGGEVRSMTPGEVAAADKAVNFVTYAYLGFNPLSAAKQTTSFTVWANALPNGFADLWRYMTHFDQAVWKHLRESDEFRVRYGNEVGAGMDYATKGLNLNPTANPLQRAVSGAGMWMLKKADFLPGGWIAQGLFKDLYNKHLSEGMSEEEADKLALTETFNMIEETQQSGRTYNTNMLQIEHGRIGRLLTQFATSPLQQLQWETQAYREYADMKRYDMGEKKIAEARQKLLRAMFINHVLLPAALNLVIAMYKAALGEEPPWEDEDYIADILIQVLLGQFSRVFFLGAFAKTTLDALFKRERPRPGQILPIEGAFGMVTSAMFTVHDLATLEYDKVKGDLERMLKSVAPTRVTYNLIRRLTGDSDIDRKREKEENKK